MDRLDNPLSPEKEAEFAKHQLDLLKVKLRALAEIDHKYEIDRELAEHMAARRDVVLINILGTQALNTPYPELGKLYEDTENDKKVQIQSILEVITQLEEIVHFTTQEDSLKEIYQFAASILDLIPKEECIRLSKDAKIIRKAIRSEQLDEEVTSALMSLVTDVGYRLGGGSFVRTTRP